MKAELFDRYVYEVGRRLPKKQRADVEAELHSLLMDALQDRLAGQDTSSEVATEADQVAILQEFDPPDKMAEQYMPPHRYLIGPRVYDIYLIVVAVVVGGITLSHLIVLLLAMLGEAEPARALVSTLVEIWGNYFNALLAGLGSVTIVFAILDRVLPESVTVAFGVPDRVLSGQAFEEKEDGRWDPRTLPEIEDRDRIQPAGLLVEIVLTAVALVVFNFFPQWVGLNAVASIDGADPRWYSIPLLSEVFFTAYLPLINVLWLATIFLQVALLRLGRWGRATRVIDLILSLYGIGILGRMLSGPAILSLAAIQSESLRELLESFLPQVIQMVLVVALLVSVGEALGKSYQLFRTWTKLGRPFKRYKSIDQ